MLYEMLTAELPYSGETVYAVMRAKTKLDPQPPSRFQPDLDPHLEEIILHAIERNLRDRYASAGEMLADLHNPARVRLTGRAHRLHPASLAGQRLRTALWTAAFFVSLIGIFALIVWLANRFPAGPAPPPRTYHAPAR